LSVPALIEGTWSTNDLVAINSMAVLVKFREPKELILPALTNALTHRHAGVRHYARDALQRIEAGANANAK
jgi:vesicle coat complex subunit